MKGWKQKWKTDFIASVNPYWYDLYDNILERTE
jgi:predicted GIY-YIG superfamily endonuclease